MTGGARRGREGAGGWESDWGKCRCSGIVAMAVVAALSCQDGGAANSDAIAASRRGRHCRRHRGGGGIVVPGVVSRWWCCQCHRGITAGPLSLSLSWQWWWRWDHHARPHRGGAADAITASRQGHHRCRGSGGLPMPLRRGRHHHGGGGGGIVMPGPGCQGRCRQGGVVVVMLGGL